MVAFNLEIATHFGVCEWGTATRAKTNELNLSTFLVNVKIILRWWAAGRARSREELELPVAKQNVRWTATNTRQMVFMYSPEPRAQTGKNIGDAVTQSIAVHRIYVLVPALWNHRIQGWPDTRSHIYVCCCFCFCRWLTDNVWICGGSGLFIVTKVSLLRAPCTPWSVPCTMKWKIRKRNIFAGDQ